MSDGDGAGLSPGQSADLERALQAAEQQCGLAFSLFIGPWMDGRVGVERMHAQLQQTERTMLIAVHPEERKLEIVTGRLARLALDDEACELASLSMTTSFAAGNLVGGIRNGLSVLGEQGRRSAVQWIDQP